MKFSRLFTAFLTFAGILFASSAFAADHAVNAEARVFNPAIIYIDVGDTVKWDNMTSHNAVSYVVPDGAKGFGEKGKLPGASFSAKFEQEGIYGYVCEPHIGFGMVGVVVVGTATPEMKDAAMAKGQELEGPFRRVLGKISKIRVLGEVD